MSLVRYNSNISDISNNELSIDHDQNINNNNGSMIVYKNRNSEQMVLYDPFKREFQIVNSIPNNEEDDDDGNNINNDIENDDDDDDDESNIRHKFRCHVCGAYNEPDEINKDKKPLTIIPKFNDETFISRDYFHLLKDYQNNKTNGKFLTIGNDNNDNDNDFNNDEIYQSIPEKLINQGYFNKFFKILNKLGTGSFGSVYKVEHQLLSLNLGIFALKKIPIGNDLKNLKKILNEVKFLYDISYNFSNNQNNKPIDNNNVVKYNHVWIEIDQISKFSPKIPVVFLLFEYCDGGTLEEFVENLINPKFSINDEKLWRRLKKVTNYRNSRYLNNFEIFKIFNDITQGLNYLHNLKILHRDLKPSNCLFKTKFNENYNNNPIINLNDLNKIPTMVVSDFGESIMVNTIEETNGNSNNSNNNNSPFFNINLETTGNTGTLEFCAPEIIKQRKNRKKYSNEENLPLDKYGGFSYSSDIYSLGMILYYLCFSKLPFNDDDISNQILNNELFNNLLNIRSLSENFENPDILLIDWIKLIKLLVSNNPNDRPDTFKILQILNEIYEKLDSNEIENDIKNEVDEEEEIEVNKDTTIIANYSSLIMLTGIIFNLFILNNIHIKHITIDYLSYIQYIILGWYLGNPSFTIIKIESLILIFNLILYSISYIIQS